MNKKTRLMQISSVLLSGALLLSGCGSSAGNAGGSSSGREQVTMWGSWSGKQVNQIQQMADAFNKTQSKYEVKYLSQGVLEQKLLTSIASGSVPDVVMWDRYQTPLYAKKGALQSIDDMVTKDNVDLNAFYPQALDEMKVDGKLYGLPLVSDVRALVYNTDMFKEAGLQPPTTWDELADTAEKLTVKGSNGKLEKSGFLLNDTGLFSMWLWQAGGELLSDDGTKTEFNSEAGEEVLNYWKKLMDAGVYSNGFADANDVFAAGKAAMKLTGPWDMETLDKASGLNYAVAEPPAGPNGDKGSVMGGFALAIPQGAKHSEGAWEFMKWWTTNAENGVKFGKISGWIPANKEGAEDDYFMNNEKFAPFVKTMEYAKTRPHNPAYSDVESKALIPSLQKFMSGKMTAKDALKSAQTEGDQLLAKASN